MNRLELQRHLAVTLLGGITGVTTGAGSTTTMVDILLSRYATNYFKNWQVFFEEGDLVGVTAVVSASATSGTLTFNTQSSAPGSSVRYVLLHEGSIDLIQRVISEAWMFLADKYHLPYYNEEITLDGATPTYDYDIPFAHEADLTADAGGTTSTIVDAALTQANDYWNGALAVIRSGAQAGAWRTVTDFVASTDTLTLEALLSAALSAGDTYTLYKPTPTSIHQLYYFDSNSRWQEIPNGTWEIHKRGGVSQIHFYDLQDGMRARVWSIQDGCKLRIVGTRLPTEPQSIHDPIEIPEGVMVAYCDYLLHRALARNPSTDPNNHAAMVQPSYAQAMDMVDRTTRSYPPDSRLT